MKIKFYALLQILLITTLIATNCISQNFWQGVWPSNIDSWLHRNGDVYIGDYSDNYFAEIYGPIPLPGLYKLNINAGGQNEGWSRALLVTGESQFNGDVLGANLIRGLNIQSQKNLIVGGDSYLDQHLYVKENAFFHSRINIGAEGTGMYFIPSWEGIRLFSNTNIGMAFSFKHNGVLEVRELHATRNLFSKEVHVKTPPFPDYVFEKDYDLLPLWKLQKYITENGHLPNIPTAEEVEKNGVEVGDLLVKQMEKIEELTLYVIELQKQIDELKNK